MFAKPSRTNRLSVWLVGHRFLRRILVVLFGTAVATVSAQEALAPAIAAERLALEARVAQVRQSFAAPGPTNDSSLGKAAEVAGVTEPVAQWLNWPNWPNWANWGNWNNWNNWGNWFNR